ncbi:DNA alkylation repair protein [Fictibacillus phosphorivorans]|uniref:DNA alkylation repair protein n=1 Tax=Fictibacillus phosphorivorans TaxID=1221500 RepID=UPI00203A6E28|nr:DNA alkylation repair protein [Fictibacillus phosphorivorans]MCM3718220.1 DNA alkylation repair protein [Fictibacillus phosphorivorans]MCM3775913.1 DNA alkylation repair protein [Fictibacillus phosphorivorans]
MYTEDLWIHLKKQENKDDAIHMKKYMRDQFEFFGLRSPVLKEHLKVFLKEKGLPPPEELSSVLKEFWSRPEREMQYAGLSVVNKLKKHMKKSDIEWIEFIILHKSWWDTIDHIAKNIAGYYFKKFPEEIIPVTERWIASQNIWLMRSAILFQLGYKEETDKERLAHIIKETKYEQDFFIRKGIGWALREYAKVNPFWVWDFVHKEKLSPLSYKEAIKNIKKTKQP